MGSSRPSSAARSTSKPSAIRTGNAKLGERAAINAPIQGTAADIIKRAVVTFPSLGKGERQSARMLLQVHGELLFEVPENELEATSAGSRGEKAPRRQS